MFILPPNSCKCGRNGIEQAEQPIASVQVEDTSLMIIETSWFAGLSRAFPPPFAKSLNEEIGGEWERGDDGGGYDIINSLSLFIPR